MKVYLQQISQTQYSIKTTSVFEKEIDDDFWYCISPKGFNGPISMKFKKNNTNSLYNEVTFENGANYYIDSVNSFKREFSKNQETVYILVATSNKKLYELQYKVREIVNIYLDSEIMKLQNMQSMLDSI